MKKILYGGSESSFYYEFEEELSDKIENQLKDIPHVISRKKYEDIKEYLSKSIRIETEKELSTVLEKERKLKLIQSVFKEEKNFSYKDPLVLLFLERLPCILKGFVDDEKEVNTIFENKDKLKDFIKKAAYTMFHEDYSEIFPLFEKVVKKNIRILVEKNIK